MVYSYYAQRSVERRVEHAKVLLNMIKKLSNKDKVRFFLDKKLFVVVQIVLRHNNRHAHEVRRPVTGVQLRLEVYGQGNGSHYCCLRQQDYGVDFVQEGKKVNTEVYIKLLDDHMIPWISANDESRSYLSNRMVYLRTQAKKRKHTSKSKT